MSLDLDQWLARLENRRPEHMVLPGLERMQAVLPRVLKDKPLARKVINVAGTNGKGSTVAFLEKIFHSAGIRYGATTSPHLVRYNERIAIDGKPVTDELLCTSFERIEALRGDTFLSYFEFGALAALDILSQFDLDIVILETGMGGRLDAMNVIDPDISVITTIGLDHQQWLGDTIEAIAAEKAGILREKRPAIYGETPVPESIRQKASALQCLRLFRDEDFFIHRHENSWDFQGMDFHNQSVEFQNLPLPELPLTSCVCAVQAALMTGIDLSQKDFINGITKATLPGRNQCIPVTTKKRQEVSVRLDVAHNPQAALYLATRLAEQPCRGRRIALVAILDDKDIRGILHPLVDAFDAWHVSTVTYELRAFDGHVLERYLRDTGINATCHKSIAHALSMLLDTLESGDELVVFGSFYTVREALEVLQSPTGYE